MPDVPRFCASCGAELPGGSGRSAREAFELLDPDLRPRAEPYPRARAPRAGRDPAGGGRAGRRSGVRGCPGGSP
jgi:hypothetical protein